MTMTVFLTNNKDLITLLIAIYAAVLSTLTFVVPAIREWRERREAVFQALQEDRKAIALVTMRVVDGSWDRRLRQSKSFRAKLLQSLAVAAGLESSDRGKAYVLKALKHIAKMGSIYRSEALEELRGVENVFQEYSATGADANFEKHRLMPLQAIIRAVDAVVQQHAPAGTVDRIG
jgi:hypothetical protein